MEARDWWTIFGISVSAFLGITLLVFFGVFTKLEKALGPIVVNGVGK